MRAPFLHRGGRTTLDVLRGITSNDELIGLLTGQWGDYGLPPAQSSVAAHAAIAEHYFNGAAYPVGGAGQIATSIIPTIERGGGQVVGAADVRQILTSNGRARGVRMADGREFLAGIVISGAGALTTYGRLIEERPADFTHEARQALPSATVSCRLAPMAKKVASRGALRSMRSSENFREFVLEQLAGVRGIRGRAMFGGVGLYADEVFFGIIASDTLYFKVDDTNRRDYELAASHAFKPYDDKPMTMPYYDVPADVLEDRDALAHWAKRAVAVAVRGKTKRAPKSVKSARGKRTRQATTRARR